MIKARIGRHNEPDLLVLGVSDENVKRLTAGQPIFVQGSDLRLPVNITIVHGETEQAIAAEMREHGLPVPPFTDPQPGEEKLWESRGGKAS